MNLRLIKSVLSAPPRLLDCPICDGTRPFLKTNRGKLVGWRCIQCRGTLAHQATYTVVKDLCDLDTITAYELSAHGALWKALKRKLGSRLTYSEFLESWTPGETYNGVRCENVEKLTFPDNSFDLVTSTGMFEHVEDDVQGYREICRVLKPGGYTIFSVPYNDQVTTIRARRKSNGEIEHFLPPAYHSDPIRGEGKVFVWRGYGADIVHTLKEAGLIAEVRKVPIWSHDVPVIVARKPS